MPRFLLGNARAGNMALLVRGEAAQYLVLAA